MAYTLVPRQQRAYSHRFNIYRASRSISSLGAPADDTWTLVAAGVPARRVLTQNDNDPTGAGRVKRRSALTEDGIHFPDGVDIKAGDLIKDVTFDTNNGMVERVMGPPRRLPNPTSGPRRPNKLIVQTFEEEKGPAGV